MAVSVRMDPLLEKELERAARQQGITKSRFIVDAVQRALGRKNPHDLMLQVQQEMSGYEADSARIDPARGTDGAAGLSTGEQFRRLLEAKHESELKDWAQHQRRKASRAQSRKPDADT